MIRNYLSSLTSLGQFYGLDTSHLSHPAVSRFLRSLSINSPFRPTPRGIFDIITLYHISKDCDSLPDPLLFRDIFLVAFYAFLRLSNIAPHSSRQFSHSKHFLRKDLIFAPPGAHLLIKWTKTLQETTSHIWFKSLALITYSYARLEHLEHCWTLDHCLPHIHFLPITSHLMVRSLTHMSGMLLSLS